MLFFDENEAIEELQRRGYRVVKEEYPTSSQVSTVKDLVNYFYSRRRFYNPDRKFPLSIDYSADTKYVSSFVQSRQKLGLGRKAALAEAAMLVDCLFKYEEKLHLREPVLRPVILAVRPIMDRICSFANGEVGEVSELETEEYVNSMNEVYNKRFSERDFDKAADERKKILEKITND